MIPDVLHETKMFLNGNFQPAVGEPVPYKDKKEAGAQELVTYNGRHVVVLPSDAGARLIRNTEKSINTEPLSASVANLIISEKKEEVTEEVVNVNYEDFIKVTVKDASTQDDIFLDECIGKGAACFGVYTIKGNPQQVVKFYKTSGTECVDGMIRKEFLMGKKLTHPCLVKSHFLHIEKDEECWEYKLIMERVFGVNLVKYLKQTKRKIDVKEELDIFDSLKSCFLYCYKNKILTNDHGPRNLILTNDNKLKLCDYEKWQEYSHEDLIGKLILNVDYILSYVCSRVFSAIKYSDLQPFHLSRDEWKPKLTEKLKNMSETERVQLLENYFDTMRSNIMYKLTGVRPEEGLLSLL